MIKWDGGNAFAKHFPMFHPEHQGGKTKFDIGDLVHQCWPLYHIQKWNIQICRTLRTWQGPLSNVFCLSVAPKKEIKQPTQHRIKRTRDKYDPKPLGQRGSGAVAGGGRSSRKGSRRKGGWEWMCYEDMGVEWWRRSCWGNVCSCVV